jgi:glycosyltransferase involved in cell wall biosynthesis
VYPSYFEGFGLPVLEAMQCGVPVIAGDRTSLPEIVKDAGLLVDPFDVHDLAAAIAQLIDDPGRRHELAMRGLARATEFNWRTTAQSTLEVYQRVATDQRP